MADARALTDSLVASLAEVLGVATGMAVRAMPAVGDAPVDWQLPLQLSGSAAGTVCLGLSRDGAAHMASAVLGGGDVPSEQDVVDALAALAAQAAEALGRGSREGLALVVGAPGPAPSPAPAGARHFDLMIGAGEPVRLVAWADVLESQASHGARTPGMQAPAAARPLGAPVALPGPPPRNLDVVLDIELPITVRFGETQMSLESLARLGPGSMIDLARSPDDPVDLLVNGRLVARGQVVVVSGCYGVRVSEVVSPADRLRTLEM